MVRRVVGLLVPALLLGAVASRSDWKMRIHKGALVEVHALGTIDSLTFFEDSLVVPALITVPAGIFTMGDGTAACGTQQRRVTLTRSFRLGRSEVTNQEYLEAVQWAYDRGYVTATSVSVCDNLDGSTQELLDLDGACEIAFGNGTFHLRSYAGHGINPNHPVKEVSWFGAARYCDWLSLEAGLPRAYLHAGDWACNGGDPYGARGYRLPTDAEWEYAAQWNDERVYPWGSEAPDCDRANYDYCVGWTTPRDAHPAAPAALGLMDMAGNGWEWCNDWHVCYLGTTAATDPTGPPSGTTRVLHGGCWYNAASLLRCAHRDFDYPSSSVSGLGLRVARTVEQ